MLSKNEEPANTIRSASVPAAPLRKRACSVPAFAWSTNAWIRPTPPPIEFSTSNRSFYPDDGPILSRIFAIASGFEGQSLQS